MVEEDQVCRYDPQMRWADKFNMFSVATAPPTNARSMRDAELTTVVMNEHLLLILQVPLHSGHPKPCVPPPNSIF